MKQDLLESLRCPDCRGGFGLEDAERAGDRIESGVLKCGRCERSYPVIGFVPRFVPLDNYAESFGFQWNRFRKTQLDSNTGIPVSRNRFVEYSGWSPEELKGKRVLDIGCGAGRFTEIALEFGARVVALDYSSAVDACRANFPDEKRLEVVQGDIYHLPFEPATFDYVYCFGVLQHTPDPAGAFMSLPRQLRDGGKLAIDVYPRLLRNLLWSKYYLRWWTRRLGPERLLAMVRWIVKYLLPLSIAVGRIPLLGRRLKYLIPVANYAGVYPLSKEQLKDWAILDTYDMLSPAHDHPQSARTVRGWFEEADMKDIEVFRKGFYVGRGRK